MFFRKVFKGWGAQVVFSSILPVAEWDPKRRRVTDQVNDWLHGWCHAQDFGFHGLGHTFEKLGMLTPDGAYHTRWDKSVLGSKLVGFISKALN